MAEPSSRKSKDRDIAGNSLEFGDDAAIAALRKKLLG
jgi:hypothetical protein